MESNMTTRLVVYINGNIVEQNGSKMRKSYSTLRSMLGYIQLLSTMRLFSGIVFYASTEEDGSPIKYNKGSDLDILSKALNIEIVSTNKITSDDLVLSGFMNNTFDLESFHNLMEKFTDEVLTECKGLIYLDSDNEMVARSYEKYPDNKFMSYVSKPGNEDLLKKIVVVLSSGTKYSKEYLTHVDYLNIPPLMIIDDKFPNVDTPFYTKSYIFLTMKHLPQWDSTIRHINIPGSKVLCLDNSGLLKRRADRLNKDLDIKVDLKSLSLGTTRDEIIDVCRSVKLFPPSGAFYDSELFDWCTNKLFEAVWSRSLCCIPKSHPFFDTLTKNLTVDLGYDKTRTINHVIRDVNGLSDKVYNHNVKQLACNAVVLTDESEELSDTMDELEVKLINFVG